MPMYVLLAIAVVLAGVLLYAADRLVRVRRRSRLRRQANARLAVAAAQAEARERERRAQLEASAALTSVLPGIHPHGPRRVA
jgi:type VI protein secretion system component VasK